MTYTPGDLSLLSKIMGDKLAGEIESYVEDTFTTGNASFEMQMGLKENIFTSSALVYDGRVLAGLQICAKVQAVYVMGQQKYSDKISEKPDWTVTMQVINPNIGIV